MKNQVFARTAAAAATVTIPAGAKLITLVVAATGTATISDTSGISAATSGGTLNAVLPAGTYTLPKMSSNEATVYPAITVTAAVVSTQIIALY